MNKLTPKLVAELKRLAAMPDEDINLSDIPEIDWTGAVRGKFYRPVKEAVTIRLDADLLAWFRAGGNGYQTRINHALREYVSQQARKKVAVHEPKATYAPKRAKRK